MNVKDLIEILRELPKGSMVVLQRNEFEALFRDSDPRRRAENIARLNGCDLALDEESGVARFTRSKKHDPIPGGSPSHFSFRVRDKCRWGGFGRPLTPAEHWG